MKMDERIMMVASISVIIYCCFKKMKNNLKNKEIRRSLFLMITTLIMYAFTVYGERLINDYSQHISEWTLDKVGWLYYLVQGIIFINKVLLPFAITLCFFSGIIYFSLYLFNYLSEKKREENNG